MSTNEHPRVVVVDFGSAQAQEMARWVRDAKVYSEVVPRSVSAEQILQDGAEVVAVVGALPKDVEEQYSALVGQVPILYSDPDQGTAVWFEVPAKGAQVAGLKLEELNPEVVRELLVDRAGVKPTWTPAEVAEELVRQVRAQVGHGRVILALSGGVDSSVVAALINEAVGDQLTCVFVDHGLLRKGEREQVEDDFAKTLGINLVTVDAEDRFLSRLAGVTDPEHKRKIIGEEFIRVFEDAKQDLIAQAAEDDGAEVRFLAQGTIYPDIIESGIGEGVSNIKSHHNVGGLPEDLQFELVEPLRTLFKDEVRAVGRALGVPEAIVSRQPFPGPGLGVRVVGALDKKRLDTLREADFIVREELTAAGLDSQIWQCPVVLLAEVHSVGTTDSVRTYGHPIVLRPIVSEDAMTADWVRLPYDVLDRISERITSEVEDVNRVVLDATRKPPATIEWE